MALPTHAESQNQDIITKKKFNAIILILIEKFRENQLFLNTLNSYIPDADFSVNIIESIEKIEKKFESQEILSIGDFLVKMGTIFLMSLDKPFGDIFGTFIVTTGLKIEELISKEKRDFVTLQDLAVSIEKAHSEIVEKSISLDVATIITNYFDKIVDLFLESNLHGESLRFTFQKARNMLKIFTEKENIAEIMAIYLIFDAFYEGLSR